MFSPLPTAMAGSTSTSNSACACAHDLQANGDLALALLGDLSAMPAATVGGGAASFLMMLTSLVATQAPSESLADVEQAPLLPEIVEEDTGEATADTLSDLVAALQSFLNGQSIELPDFTRDTEGKSEPTSGLAVDATLTHVDTLTSSADMLTKGDNVPNMTSTAPALSSSAGIAAQSFPDVIRDLQAAGGQMPVSEVVASKPIDVLPDATSEHVTDLTKEPVTSEANDLGTQVTSSPATERVLAQLQNAQVTNPRQQTGQLADVEHAGSDDEIKVKVEVELDDSLGEAPTPDQLRQGSMRFEERFSGSGEEPSHERDLTDFEARVNDNDSSRGNEAFEASLHSVSSERTREPVKHQGVDVTHQIADSFKMVREQTGQTPARIEIELDPPELGRMSVELTESEGGVTARISANREATAALVDSQLSALKQTLHDAGVSVSEFHVSYDFNHSAHQQSRHDAEPQQPRELNSRSLSGVDRSRSPAALTPVNSATPSGVDLRL